MKSSIEISDEDKKKFVEKAINFSKINIRDKYPIDFCIMNTMDVQPVDNTHHMIAHMGPEYKVTAFTDSIDFIGIGIDFAYESIIKYNNGDLMPKYTVLFTDILLLHEIRHKALRYCTRVKGNNNTLFNIAQDYIINGELKNLFHDDMPTISIKDVRAALSGSTDSFSDGIMLDRSINVDDHSTESIYAMLLDSLEQNPKFNNNDNSYSQDGEKSKGQPLDIDNLDDNHISDIMGDSSNSGMSGGDVYIDNTKHMTTEELGEYEESVRQAIDRGIKICKERGIEPGNYYKKLHNIGIVEPCFAPHLLSHITKRYRKKVSWSRMNRRKFANSRQVWPYKSKNPKNHIAIIVDTSASCFLAYRYFFETINGILKRFSSIEKIHVIQVDVKVASHETYESNEIITSPYVMGGGGTYFTPGFEYIINEKIDVDTIIYLTDGHAVYPQDYGIHTIWCIIDDGPQPDWGHVVNINSSEYSIK